jgi:sensor histidine kinase YesM
VRKPSGEWSVPVECKVKIYATFWQHPLFYIALSVICVGLIILFILLRKNIQIKRRELDHQLISLEQKALQSMMNPHFIFNSLGSIQNYLLQKKSGEAGVYLSQFARLIRQNLNSINAASINLEEEIDRLKNYLDLEKLRMENKFEYNIEVAENVDADELQIPSMIIQPFVENAIWHGIAFLQEKGQIIIKFQMQDDKSLTVVVEDNGIGMKRAETFSSKQEKHLHLGMEMTRKRLEILGKKFSVKTSLTFSECFPGNLNPGTRVEMVVPVII